MAVFLRAESIGKSTFRFQGGSEPDLVLVARDFFGSEASQMFREKLHVQQLESPALYVFHQMQQGHLRGIGLVVKHRFTEKRTSQ